MSSRQKPITQLIERGLETPRRVAAVEQLSSMGWWWDGKKWVAPSEHVYAGKGRWEKREK